MNKKEIILTEDYLILKGIEGVLNDPDKLRLDRQSQVKTYINLIKNNKSRVSYLKNWIDE